MPAYGSPVPRRPLSGVTMGTPGVFTPLSDPRWFLGTVAGGGTGAGGGGVDGGACCEGEVCPTPAPSAEASLAPSGEGGITICGRWSL
jgi:hypothetical protein